MFGNLFKRKKEPVEFQLSGFEDSVKEKTAKIPRKDRTLKRYVREAPKFQYHHAGPTGLFRRQVERGRPIAALAARMVDGKVRIVWSAWNKSTWHSNTEKGRERVENMKTSPMVERIREINTALGRSHQWMSGRKGDAMFALLEEAETNLKKEREQLLGWVEEDKYAGKKGFNEVLNIRLENGIPEGTVPPAWLARELIEFTIHAKKYFRNLSVELEPNSKRALIHYLPLKLKATNVPEAHVHDEDSLDLFLDAAVLALWVYDSQIHDEHGFSDILEEVENEMLTERADQEMTRVVVPAFAESVETKIGVDIGGGGDSFDSSDSGGSFD